MKPFSRQSVVRNEESETNVSHQDQRAVRRSSTELRTHAQTARDAAVVVVLALVVLSVRVELPGSGLDGPVSHAGPAARVAQPLAPAVATPAVEAPSPAVFEFRMSVDDMTVSRKDERSERRYIVLEVDQDAAVRRIPVPEQKPDCGILLARLSS